MMSPPKAAPTPLLLQYAQKDCIIAGSDNCLPAPRRTLSECSHWVDKVTNDLLPQVYCISAVLCFCDWRRQVQRLMHCNLMSLYVCCGLRFSSVHWRQSLVPSREMHNVVTEQRAILKQKNPYTTAWWKLGVCVCCWTYCTSCPQHESDRATKGTMHISQSHANQYPHLQGPMWGEIEKESFWEQIAALPPAWAARQWGVSRYHRSVAKHKT